MKLNYIALFIVFQLVFINSVNSKESKQPRGTDANIIGHVIDAKTGDHIPFINVLIKDTRIGTTTDASGHFLLTNLPTGEHTIVVKGMGYEEKQVNFEIEEKQTKEVNVKVEYIGLQLDEVVLTASPVRSGYSYQSNQVFIGENLQRRSEVSFGEMLDGEPGISMRSMGSMPARPVIRGLDGDRILVLQDGERMGDVSETAADHAISLDPLAANRVEVVRGPASLLYGSSALGGVVNIMTTDIPTDWSLGGSGVLSGQAATVNNMGAGFARYTHGYESLAATARFSYRKAGNINTPEGEIPSTSLENYDGAVGFGFNNENVSGGFSVSLANQVFELPEDGAIEDPNETVEIRADRQLLQGRLNFKLNDFFDNAELRLNGSHFFQQEVEIENIDGEIDEDIEFEFDKYSLSSTLTLQHRAIGIFDRGALGVNFRGHTMDVGGDEAFTPGEDRINAGLFTFKEVPLSGMLRLQFGVRFDFNKISALPNELFPDINSTRNSFNYSGSVGLNIRPISQIEIGAQFARSHRNPVTEELYADGPHVGAGVYEVGCPNINDEIGHGGDLFFRWKADNFNAEIAGFINSFDNFIMFVPSGEIDEDSGYEKFYYQDDEAILSGGEISFDWTIFNGFIWSAGLDYVNGRVTGDSDGYLPYIPPFRLRSGLQYEYGQGWIGASVKNAAKKKNVAENEMKTDGYTIIGAQAGYRIDYAGRHVIILRVENLMDDVYRDHLSRIESRDIPMPGRNFNLSYRYFF